VSCRHSSPTSLTHASRGAHTTCAQPSLPQLTAADGTLGSSLHERYVPKGLPEDEHSVATRAPSTEHSRLRPRSSASETTDNAAYAVQRTVSVARVQSQASEESAPEDPSDTKGAMLPVQPNLGATSASSDAAHRKSAVFATPQRASNLTVCCNPPRHITDRRHAHNLVAVVGQNLPLRAAPLLLTSAPVDELADGLTSSGVSMGCMHGTHVCGSELGDSDDGGAQHCLQFLHELEWGSECGAARWSLPETEGTDAVEESFAAYGVKVCGLHCRAR
jgi:hypothetical protein